MNRRFFRIREVINGKDADDWIKYFQEEHGNESDETFYDWLNR